MGMDRTGSDQVNNDSGNLEQIHQYQYLVSSTCYLVVTVTTKGRGSTIAVYVYQEPQVQDAVVAAMDTGTCFRILCKNIKTNCNLIFKLVVGDQGFVWNFYKLYPIQFTETSLSLHPCLYPGYEVQANAAGHDHIGNHVHPDQCPQLLILPQQCLESDRGALSNLNIMLLCKLVLTFRLCYP